MVGKKLTILVIEDEVLLLEAISKKLKISDCDVVGCSSGQQALDYLNNLPKKPDAIWLDYYLGDTNGIDLMEIIHENKTWSSIPVLVVSNSASPEKVHKMLDLGVNKYLIKAEHRLDDLVTEIKKLT